MAADAGPGSVGGASVPGLDELPSGLLTTTLDGALAFANAPLRAMIGLVAGDVTGQSLDRVLMPASIVLFQSYLLPMLRLRGQVDEFRVDLRGAGGPLAALAFARLRPTTGEGLVDLTIVPMGDRRRLEDDLVRIRQAAELAPVMLFHQTVRADGSSCMPYATNVIRGLYGLTPAQVAESDAPLFARVHPDDLGPMLEARAAAHAAARPWRCRFRVVCEGGAERVHEVTASERVGPDGGAHWYGVISDVSEREALEGALRDKHAAERASQSKSEFLARMSHEFRTPLNGIIGFSQVLAAGVPSLGAAQREQVRLIERSGRALLRLVNEVLDIARVESGALELQLRQVEVRPLVLGVLALLQPEADAVGVRLAHAEGAGRHVVADPNRLRQVLSNLVSNAIKYNRRGGEVRVDCRRAGERVFVAVRDTGVGMDAGQLSELFRPFHRVGGQRLGVDGTGLGLVIARQLVEAMSGGIEVRSEVGVGSVFEIWLPVGEADSGATSLASQAPPPSREGRATRRVVMHVEDNDVNVALMESIFALRPGWALVTLRDAASALAHARVSGVPDLLLLDLHLPDASGVAMLASLRALPGWSKVPAVAVSADALPQSVAGALANGFQAYWTKPLEVGALLTALDRLLQPHVTGGEQTAPSAADSDAIDRGEM